MIHFQPVENAAEIKRTADLARLIWTEHYIPMIGKPQVDYMLENYQSPQAIERQIKTEGLHYFLVTEEIRDHGYFAIQYRETDLFVSKFYLEKTARGKGLARKILSYVEALAAEKGLLRVALVTNKNNRVALRAYEGLGFKIVGPVVTEIGEGYVMDDYRLEKEVG
jgi:GNAT superfamily N-acetyltransferase